METILLPGSVRRLRELRCRSHGYAVISFRVDKPESTRGRVDTRCSSLHALWEGPGVSHATPLRPATGARPPDKPEAPSDNTEHTRHTNTHSRTRSLVQDTQASRTDN